MPAWRGDGKEIFFISPDRKMMAAAVTTAPSFDAATPVVLFDAPIRAHQARQYDVSPDGTHFLLNRLVESAPIEPIAVLQNWADKVP